MNQFKKYLSEMNSFWTTKYKKLDGQEYKVVGNIGHDYEQYTKSTDKIKGLLYPIMDREKSLILDYGCGIGRFRDFLLNFYSSYMGVDLVKKIQLGSFIYAPDYLKNTIRCDGIFTSVVLQHIVNDDYVKSLFDKFVADLYVGGKLYMNEQTGRGAILYRRGFPYINQRSENFYIEQLQDRGMKLLNKIKDGNHMIFKFEKS